MIGDGHGREAQFAGALHEPVEAAGAVEQRELRVEMEMDEFGVAGHREGISGQSRRLSSIGGQKLCTGYPQVMI